MKKIVYLLIFIFSITSCDVLDLKPLDMISDADVWNDKALIEAYVNASYSAIPHGYRQDVLGMCCDEVYHRHDYGRASYFLRGILTPDNVTSLGTNANYWSTAYRRIRSINTYFSKIDDSPVEVSFKTVATGEMKFLRAFIYAQLIWRYGGVPIITKVYELNEDYSIARNTYDECVDFIIAELDEAINLLPAKQPASQLGRASGDACKALKARVLLYAASELNNPAKNKARWQKAADAAEALIGKYSLLDDYQSVFLSDNDEIIFARSQSQSNSADYHLWNGRNGDNGWGGSCPTQSMVDAYEMAATGELPYTEQPDGTFTLNQQSGYNPDNPYVGRDPRFYASVLYDGSIWQGRETESWRGGLDSPESTIGNWNTSLTSYFLKKFLNESIPPRGSSERPSHPWIWFRYAEVLLNYAEAKFELGDEETAREFLNKVRSRKSVNMPPVTDTGDKLRKRIHNERRVELFFEEHRFFDVRRWKIAMNTDNQAIIAMNIQKLPDGTKTYKPVFYMERTFLVQHYLLPIPRTEIERSLDALKQNPGY